MKVKCVCNGKYGGINIRDKPSLESNIIGSIKHDSSVDVEKVNADWFKLSDGTGYVASAFEDSRGTINWQAITTKKKKAKIPATVRNIVWTNHIGSVKTGKCWCCKVEDISTANFDCGHVISEKNGGQVVIENLRPICGHCNKSIGSMNMEDFKKKYGIN